MEFSRVLRNARLSLARAPGLGRAPHEPALLSRDLWPGDPSRGVRLLRGEMIFDGTAYRLPGAARLAWEQSDLPSAAHAHLLGFSWLRDLRSLGTDEARLVARKLVGLWLDQHATDPLIADAAVTGTRLAAWLGTWDFFVASADPVFRQALMDRVLVEARTVAAMLPLPVQGWRGLAALRGLLASGLAMPEHRGLLARFQRFLVPELERLVLNDGGFAERSPEAQLNGARELAEIIAMLRTAQLTPPPALTQIAERICAALRALRHGDGALALFNGSFEHDAAEIERVLNHGARQRLVAPSLPDTGFIRVAQGRSLLLVDAGKPAPPGFDRTSHAGTLGFEFSVGRQRLIVNCGAACDGDWAAALRASPAHSVLVPDGRSSSDFASAGGLARRPVNVRADQNMQDGACWLDLSHDGYRASLGAEWRRRLYLGDQGNNLMGQEVFEGERAASLALRFHLHPEVQAELAPDADEILLQADGMIWRFLHDSGTLSLEESLYRGRGVVQRTRQIVVRLEPGATAPDPESEVEAPKARPVAAPNAVPRRSSPARIRQVLGWALERVPE